MKVQTINGENLRKEYTAFEAAALKHAAEFCIESDQFTGVPTSSEDRYRRSPETFGVVRHDGKTVEIIRHKTGDILRAQIVWADGEKPRYDDDDETLPEAKPEEFDAENIDDDIEVPKQDSENESEDNFSEDSKDEVQDDAEEEISEEASEHENKSDTEEKAEEESTEDVIPNPADPFALLIEQVKKAVLSKLTPELEKMNKQTENSIKSAIEPLVEKFAKQGGVKQEIAVKINDVETKIEGLTHPVFAKVLKYVANHQNVYLYGPAGSGKNVICEQIANALGVPFYYQNTLLTKFDVTGYRNAAGEFEETEFYKAWTSGGLYMLDEMDNSTAEALVTLNAALANGYYTFPGYGRVERHPDFYCVAAGNTNGQGATDEYCGRFKMDESSRDRFWFVEVDYAPDIEKAIANGRQDILDFVHELRNICKEQRISLICGYRAVKNLAMFYDDEPADAINHAILRGLEMDAIREIAHRLTGTNKYHEAFRKLACI